MKKFLSLLVLCVLVLGLIGGAAVVAQEPTPEPLGEGDVEEVVDPTTTPMTPTTTIDDNTVVGVGEEEVAPTKDDIDVVSSDSVGVSAATTKQLSTNFTMVNLDANDDAAVTLEYLKEGGASWSVGTDYAGPFTLPKNGGQLQLRQYFDTSMSTGRGSVSIASSTPLGAVAQIQARGQTPSNGAYSGATSGSAKVYVPLLAKNASSASGLVNGMIVIQNTGDSQLSDVRVILVDLVGNTTYTKSSITISPKASYYYDLSTESASNIPNGWFGSATVETASGEIAVVGNLFAGADMLQTYNGFTQEEVSNKWTNPSFFARLGNGLNTVMSIQNVSGSAMASRSITAQCVETLSNTGRPTLTLTNPNAIGNFVTYNFNPVTDTSIPAGWVGACTVTAPGDSVMFVQMRTVGGDYPSGGAFNALNGNGTNTQVTVPLVGKRLGNGFATVVTIQNLSSTAGASVTFQYSYSSESQVKQNVTVGPYIIPAGASLQHNHRLVGNGGTGSNIHNLPDGWVGSLTVTSTGTPIDGYVQLTALAPGSWGGGDTFMAHNAFVQ